MHDEESRLPESVLASTPGRVSLLVQTELSVPAVAPRLIIQTCLILMSPSNSIGQFVSISIWIITIVRA